MIYPDGIYLTNFKWIYYQVADHEKALITNAVYILIEGNAFHFWDVGSIGSTGYEITKKTDRNIKPVLLFGGE